MRFCKTCNNVLFITTNSDNLVYSCAICGYKEETDTTQGSVCVIDDNKVDDDILYQQYMSKFIKHDPTLPHVNNIPCVNPECSKPESAEPDTIYVKYDHTNMKYAYMCCYCDHRWRLNSKS